MPVQAQTVLPVAHPYLAHSQLLRAEVMGRAANLRPIAQAEQAALVTTKGQTHQQAVLQPVAIAVVVEQAPLAELLWLLEPDQVVLVQRRVLQEINRDQQIPVVWAVLLAVV